MQMYPVNINSGIVFCAHRHLQCIRSMSYMTGKRSVVVEVGEYVQGFLTSLNRFVDRTEGYRIAYDAKQLLVKKSKKGTLYSEDIY